MRITTVKFSFVIPSIIISERLFGDRFHSDLLKSSFKITSKSFLNTNLMTYYLTNDKSVEKWFTYDSGKPIAVAYCAPERMTQGTWNLFLLLYTLLIKGKEGVGDFIAI